MSRPGAAVTVVIPVWDDYVEFLPEAVESVRRNDAQAAIVVVDNASSIPVPELEGCEVVRSPRRLSVGAARNLGLERVATDYVVVLDADDMLLEGALGFMWVRMAADDDLTIVATSILDSGTGQRHRAPRRAVARLARWPRVFAFANSIWSLLPIQGCAVMRAAQVREAGKYPDADLGDDWVLAVSLAWRGRIEVSERLGRYYRRRADSIAGRPWTLRELRANALLVRDRLRSDSGVPAWVRAVIPAVALLQLAAIYVARPVYRFARSIFRTRSNIR